MLFDDAVEEYRVNGVSLIKSVISKDEINKAHENIQNFVESQSEGIFYEDDSRAVRAIYGAHLKNSYFEQLTKNPIFLSIAKHILKDDVYVHQFKVNLKKQVDGERWPWHQDFVFWRSEDNIAEPNLVNFAIALNDHTPKNGPMRFIPGSHRSCETEATNSSDSSGWYRHVSKDLQYQTNEGRVERLIADHGCHEMLVEAGDVFFFDPMVVHGSEENTSSTDRSVLIITYNSISNKPSPPFKRPGYFCSQNFESL
jgi:ectoine hydroxylase